GNEVQLEGIQAEDFSPINLEDFPQDLAKALQPQIPGLTVRRAFRYSSPSAIAALKASAVEPDVRVDLQSTLSLSEDRTVLGANAAVEITRAGRDHAIGPSKIGHTPERCAGISRFAGGVETKSGH